MAIESGWVIEHESSEASTPDYFWIDVNRNMDWTPDHLKAIRFARREDAEAMALVFEGSHRIAEHQWG